jgi:hypothetical protein
MMKICASFREAFAELEQGIISEHRRWNSFTERGKELDALLDRYIEGFSVWHDQCAKQVAQITVDFNPEDHKIHKAYVRQSSTHRLFQEAPYYWRLIHKPEGYTGDAEMMSIIYRKAYEGDTPFGRLVHKSATLCAACQAVRNRRVFLRDQIITTGGGRILSVAAGPAMEIQDVLKQDQSEDTYHCHAYDHDIKTIRKTCRECIDPRLRYVLGNAFHLIEGSYKVAIPRRALLGACNPKRDFRSWRKALAPVKYSFTTLKKEYYDLVYTAGLYDRSLRVSAQ